MSDVKIQMSNVNGQMSNVKSKSAGFTLIELLVVMAILAVLFAIIIIAVNPVRQNQQANNTERRSDINSILNAVYHYAADTGALPTSISTSLKVIGTAATGCASLCGASTPQDACANLTSDLTLRYMNEIPKDPTTGTDAITRYAIFKSVVENRVKVIACDAELGATIEVER